MFNAYDFRPFSDIEQKVSLRPIGFDGSSQKTSIDETTFSYSMSPIVSMSDQGLNDLSDETMSSRVKISKVWVNASSKKGQELFEQKFDTSTSEQKETFLANVAKIIDELTQQIYIFDMSSRPPHQKWKMRSMSKQTVDEFFKLKMRRDFLAQNEVYVWAFHYLAEISKSSTGYWDLYERFEETLARLNQLKSVYSKRVYARGYFSTTLKEEWLLIDKQLAKCRFIRKDLSEVRVFEGKWLTDGSFLLATQEAFDKFEFLQNEPLDLDVMISGVNRAKYRLEKCFQLQIRAWPGEELAQFSVSTTQGLALPIAGYIFQLSNPPRHFCRCKPKHSIKGGFPESIPREFQLVYYECADQSTIDYIKLYTIISNVISQIYRKLWTGEATEIIRKPREFDIEFLEKPENLQHRFLFYQMHGRKTGKDFVLLDLPKIKRRERVPVIDLNEKLFAHLLVNQKIDKEAPIQMSIREFLEIAKDGLVKRTTTV